jgi:AraC-like DNA-binding protein
MPGKCAGLVVHCSQPSAGCDEHFKTSWWHFPPASTFLVPSMKAFETTQAKYVNLLIRWLEGQGGDCSGQLATHKLERAVVAHPDASLPTSRALSFFQSLMRKVIAPDLGLRVGSGVSPGFLGDVGHGMLSSATIGDALKFCEQHYGAVTNLFSMQVREQGKVVEITWLPIRALPYDIILFAFDLALAAFDRFAVLVMGHDCPLYDAYLTRSEPSHAAAYRKMVRVRCHFGGEGIPSLRICVPAAVLAVPMPLRHPEACAAAHERLLHRQATTPELGQVTPWVSMMLWESNGCQPSIEFLAKTIGVSGRTLNRKLTAEGGNFRELSTKVRFERACRMLAQHELTVAQISSRLGYADVPSFIRAFKAVSGGVPPGHYVWADRSTNEGS